MSILITIELLCVFMAVIYFCQKGIPLPIIIIVCVIVSSCLPVLLESKYIKFVSEQNEKIKVLENKTTDSSVVKDLEYELLTTKINNTHLLNELQNCQIEVVKHLQEK
jgi:hypothetical protein